MAFNQSGFLKHIPDAEAAKLIKKIVHAERVYWGTKAADNNLGSLNAKADFGTTDSDHQDTVKRLNLREAAVLDREVSQYIGRLSNYTPALQYFLYFVPLSFWEKVAAATNKYYKKWVENGCGVGEGLDAEDEFDEQLRDTFAQTAAGDKQKVRGYGLEWQDVTVQDLLKFVGLCLSHAVNPRGSLQDQWDRTAHGGIPSGIFGDYMSRNRFMQIKRFLYLNHVDRDTDIDPHTEKLKCPFHKVKPLVDVLKSTFKQCWQMGFHVTLDEQGVPYRGRFCPFLVYNPMKPHKWAMRIFALHCSESNYCYDFEIYTGKGMKFPDHEFNNNLNFTTRTVLHMIRNLDGMDEPIRNNDAKYCVHADRWFTSITGAMALQAKGVAVNGTLKLNVVPKEMKAAISYTVGKFKRGFGRWMVLEQDLKQMRPRHLFTPVTGGPDICSVQVGVWNDRNKVPFISTLYGPATDYVLRNMSDGIHSDDEEDDSGWARRTVSAPKGLASYMAHMGAVDIFDQTKLARSGSLELNMISNKVVAQALLGTPGHGNHQCMDCQKAEVAEEGHEQIQAQELPPGSCPSAVQQQGGGGVGWGGCENSRHSN